MSRLDGFFRKAEQAASDLVEAVRFGIFGPPRRRELAVERMRIAGPADTEALRRALVESHRFLFPMQEKHMATKPHRPDPGTAETVLISTPDVSRVMARIRAIAMGNPRETDVDGKPLPPLDLAVLVLMLGSDLLNLREVHGATEEKRAEVTELLDELRTVSANDNRCNAEVIEKLRAERDAGLAEAGSLRTDRDMARRALEERGDEVRDLRTELEKLRMANAKMADHERATSLSIATLQAEVAGLNERLARTTEERDRYLNDLADAEVAEGAMR